MSTVTAPLIGLILLLFASEWQINLQYLAQRGEVSGWSFLGGTFELLIFCLIIFPATSGFLFAPRQRLIATQDGLICQYRLRFSFIPWHEALLFAVIAEQNQTQVYELASNQTSSAGPANPRGAMEICFHPRLWASRLLVWYVLS